MKKIVVIGDIHGKSIWKEIVKKESDADTIIFIGDYLDSYEYNAETMANNFNDIEAFKVNAPIDQEVVLLVGNHDLSYICSICKCSGYDVGLNDLIGAKITELFRSGFIKTFHREGKIIFSHAGITKKWLSNMVEYLNIPRKDIFGQLNYINEIVKGAPSLLGYLQKDLSGYGNHVEQSPLWIRPKEFISNCLEGVDQVVGHTKHPRIIIDNVNSTKDNLIFIDVLDYINEYLVIEFSEDGFNYKYSVKELDIITEEFNKLQLKDELDSMKT